MCRDQGHDREEPQAHARHRGGSRGAGRAAGRVGLKPRVLEHLGRLLGFSPEGRKVRVWTHSRPGEEDAVIVAGTIFEVTPRGATVRLEDGREVLAVPTEDGWGFDAMWFGFIAVEAFEDEKPVGQWWLRLGSPSG